MATLTANAWNGLIGGIILFRGSGIVSGSGTIPGKCIGLHGGAAANGEGYGGGIKGLNSYFNNTAYGGGGGYGTAGAGIASSSSGTGAGGPSYGDPLLNTLFFGSGGGAGGDYGHGTSLHSGANGGNGGGNSVLHRADHQFLRNFECQWRTRWQQLDFGGGGVEATSASKAT